MWSTPQYLTLCLELKAAGFVFPIEPGVKVARGFADLGAEEFLLLLNQTLLSLFTGEKSPLPDDYEDHFCVVPTIEQLLVALRVKTGEVVSIGINERGRGVINGEDVGSLAEGLAIKLLATVDAAMKPAPKLITV